MMTLLGFGYQIFKRRTNESLTLLPCHEKSGTHTQQHRVAGNKVIAVCDVVYQSIKEIATKLDPRFEGTYRVIGIENSNNVKVRHLTDYNTKIVHIDHLKRVSRSMDYGEELSSPKSPSAPEQALHHQRLLSIVGN